MSVEYTRVLNDQIAALESENEALLLEIERLQEIEDKPADVPPQPIDRPYEMAMPHIIFCPANYGFCTDRRMVMNQQDMQAELANALKLIMELVATMTSPRNYETSIRKVADVNNLKVLTELLKYSSAEELLGKRRYYQDHGYYDNPYYDDPDRYRLRK